jgi:hypothetical protein
VGVFGVSCTRVYPHALALVLASTHVSAFARVRMVVRTCVPYVHTCVSGADPAAVPRGLRNARAWRVCPRVCALASMCVTDSCTCACEHVILSVCMLFSTCVCVRVIVDGYPRVRVCACGRLCWRVCLCARVVRSIGAYARVRVCAPARAHGCVRI